MNGKSDDLVSWWKEIYELVKKHYFLTGPFKNYPSTPMLNMKELERKYNTRLLKLIDEMKENTPKTPSILKEVITASKEGSMSDESMRSNITGFLASGYEQTSTTFQNMIYFLAKYPDYQNRVRDEIMKFFPDENFGYEKIKDLTLLNNVLNENLRLLPPTIFIGGRLITEETEIEGWHLPKGIRVLGSIWRLHHNKEIWGEDVDEFRPERFDNLTHLQKRSFIPFGGGARVCMGMNFAMLEKKIILSKMLMRYEILLEEDTTYKVTPVSMEPDPNFKYILRPINKWR